MSDEPENALFVLDRYQVLQHIGQGGFGDVYRAYDPLYKRTIALKRLRTDIPVTDARRTQFLNEATLTSQLFHPAIIPIYSIHEQDDPPYYTMPFVEGKTVKDLLILEPDIPVKALCAIFLQICQAVACAHSKGYVHRDLKPSNIMVGSHGQVVILDWGLIRLMSAEKEKSVSGTMAYIAPELVYGEPPSSQSEIFSLGMILYQMLTKRLPYHRNTVEEYVKTINKEVLVDPQIVAPDRGISPIVAKIALKCLSNVSAARYQTVDELVNDLHIYLEGRCEWLSIAHTDLESNFSDDFKMCVKVQKVGKVGFFLTPSGKPEKHGHSIWLTDLEKNQWYDVVIERAGYCTRLFVNGILQSISTNYEPHKTCKIGIHAKSFKDFAVFVTGQVQEKEMLPSLKNARMYRAKKQYEKEAGCFEEGFRHGRHPELRQELICRLQSAQLLPRKVAAYFFLLAARYVPVQEMPVQVHACMMRFKSQLEPLFFFEGEQVSDWSSELKAAAFAISLAFWLARRDIIGEIIDDLLQMSQAPLPHIENGLFALLELGGCKEKLEVLRRRFLDVQAIAKLELIEAACQKHPKPAALAYLPEQLEGQNLQAVWHILEKSHHVHEWAAHLRRHRLSFEQQVDLDCYEIWSYLAHDDAARAGDILKQYPLKKVAKLAHSLNFLYGCWIGATEGKKKAVSHFLALWKEKLPPSWPPSWQSFLLLITSNKKASLKEAFWWEKRRLFRRAFLFYHCIGNHKQAQKYLHLASSGSAISTTG